MKMASMMPLVLATTNLRVITSLVSLILIVELALSGVVTSPTSFVAGVLVSMKTPLWLLAVPHPSQTITFATSSTIVIVKPVEGLSLGITRSLGVIKAKNEFVAEMVDGFIRA